MEAIRNYFKFSENNTDLGTEIQAGITTFLAMSYIMFVNPAILSQAGMPAQGVFLATIFAAAISTLFIGIFANVPYALAPGMGLNAFFTYTVVFALGFTWQEALSMVFICGILNVLITITKIRKLLIVSIPAFLQHAISAGIGIFIGYIGLKNAGLLQFTSGAGNIISVNNGDPMAETISGGVFSVVTDGGIVPELVNFTQPGALIAVVGIIVTIILMMRKSKGAILIGIAVTTVLAFLTNVVDLGQVSFADNSLSSAFADLGQIFGVIFTSAGIPSLFGDLTRLPIVLMTIFAFSLSDVFDTIGTFIGTGLRSGIFSKADQLALESGSGFTSKMDKALFGDSVGTIFGAILGTSNTTTFVESSAGIGAGGRTGFTSVVTALCFVLSAFLSPIISLIPAQATAPALIIVGILMVSSLSDIDWSNFEDAVPAFFASVFMGLTYSISNGIAAGFILYGIIKTAKGQTKEVHPIIWVSIVLFIINFIVLAII
ncbi:NCS2 family permease [Facklamia sp. P12945]|uniref:NCS2 family permease n=1 Tax=unclassified Facklamia TaxID=2622293 RepID=UPI003D181392